MSLYRDDPSARLAIAVERDWRRLHRVLAFSTGVVVALGGSLLVARVESSRNLLRTPDVDLLLTTPRAVGTRVRVEGDFVPGSLVRQESPCEYRFAMEKNGFRMPVRFASCVLSDPFEAAARDEEPTPITVDGELKAGGFVASTVMARVPSCCYCREGQKERMKAWRDARRAAASP